MRLRAAPRVAPAPARIVFTAQLEGGEDSEALHCLRLEWSWDEGSNSSSDGDCGEFVAGQTEVQRVFQANHEYREEGRYTAEVRVFKGERLLGRDSVSITVGPRKEDPRLDVHTDPRDARRRP